MDEQVIITMSVEEFRAIIREEVDKALDARPAKPADLPPLLTRKEFMDLLHISSPTAQKLYDTPGFPVFRRTGTLLFETEKVFEWLRDNPE